MSGSPLTEVLAWARK